jgi:chromosome segregation protein
MPLRLKSLELHGYKTFAARTLFEFAAGITAIVGPNGAGKSNIADALRWVLGEQSYSLLRGKKTEDMIFSGSEHRPRSGMASAEIVFDNSASWLPVDFSEVSLTRRAYRDGHNDYLLNAQHVRLRDMNELLAASGLSERTYTIVGQGLVDASLALKADERRRLFEEAAGVGLYRVRREEALKRLENTQRNLERVQDIMAELEPRLKTLERQARRAKEYGAAQADLRAVLREWYGYHWHKTQQQLQESQVHVRTVQAKADEARELHDRAQVEMSQFRERLSGMRAQLNAWHRELSELYQQRETVSLDLAVLEERRRSLLALHTELTSQQQAVSAELEMARERLRETEAESARLKAELEEAKGEVVMAQQALQTRQSGRGAIEAELQAARDAIARLGAGKAEGRARLDELGVRLDGFQKKREAAERDVRSIEAESQSAERLHGESRAKLEEIRAQLEKTLALRDAKKATITEAEERRRAQLDEQSNLRTHHSRLQAQLEVIQEAEQSLAGYAEGARYLLEAARQERLRAHGALSSVLDLPPELETAISAALGDTLDTVILDDSQVESALQLLESDEAGRAALLSLNGRRGETLSRPSDPELVGIASQLVQSLPELKAAVEVLLGNTLIVRTRAAARRLVPAIPTHARIVTLRGEVFRGDGIILAGRSATPSTLSRPRQKRELVASLGEAAARLAGITGRLEASSKQLQTAAAELNALESQVREQQQAVEEQHAAEQKIGLEAERQRRNLEWNQSRQGDLLKEISEAEEDQRRLAAAVQEFDVKTETAREDERRLTNAFNQMSIEEAREQAAYWSTRAAVAEQTFNSIEVRRAERQESVSRIEKQTRDLQLKLEESDTSLRQFDGDRAGLLEREGKLHAEVESKQAHADPAEKNLEGAEREESRLQGVESEAQKSLTNVERALSQAEIELVRRQESLESLRGRIMDDFGLVAFQYAENVEGPVPLPFEGLVEELPVVMEVSPELEEQLTQRRARLRRLGLINPEAAREYDAESERYSFMTAQVHDLHEAEADLRQVIAELDELTRQEFSRTYYAVDKQFRSIFTRLFGGGTAHLSLTDPDNLVETGIEIEARLPGRREQGLSLLSGGERSLTAIALVFALLKVSPTPVCVMDEVDAMLDEANVGRFRDLLQELSQDTQFIIITHNRNTVQAADFIYGVTMGRDSASQVISLKLDEVSEEMLGTSRT